MITMYGASVEDVEYPGNCSLVEEEFFATEELRDQWVEIMQSKYEGDLQEGSLHISKWERPLFESMEEYNLDRAYGDAIIEDRRREREKKLANNPELQRQMREQEERIDKLLEELGLLYQVPQ